MSSTPSLASVSNQMSLVPRGGPYWNILEFCRHIGIRKNHVGVTWVARVRLKSGGYRQTQLAPVKGFEDEGVDYASALALAEDWFASDAVKAESASPYPKGVNTTLKYSKQVDGFTVGDSMRDYVEWKRISGARTHFETSLSLINHHIIPRLGDVLVENFTGRLFTEFCRDVLESPPRRGRQPAGARIPLQQLDHDALRKRKKTLNSVISILRTAFRMAWENDEVASDKAWRCLKRLPHADTPRHTFLTRNQCQELMEACTKSLRGLVMGALYTGCRVSELSQMRVRDVGGHFFGVFVRPMKSYRSRHVHLTSEGMSFFLDQCEGKRDEDLVFTMESGREWKGSHKHLFRSAVRQAGLPHGFVFHGLRHTYASQLVQAGTPLAIVAKQLGHATTDTVSRTYGHLSCQSIEEELERRFAPLMKARKDPRLSGIKTSLQTPASPSVGWPDRNHSQATGELVEFLQSKR